MNVAPYLQGMDEHNPSVLRQFWTYLSQTLKTLMRGLAEAEAAAFAEELKAYQHKKERSDDPHNRLE